MQTGDQSHPARGRRIRRRDRHGRGMRGVLVPPGVPLHRTRAQQFDDLVLDAVARLEPRWESQLAQVEFAVEEIPAEEPEVTSGGVPLGRLELGSPEARPGDRARPSEDRARPTGAGAAGTGAAAGDFRTGGASGGGRAGGAGAQSAASGGRGQVHPPRIVVYRQPVVARAEGEEELGELVFDVVVEEFARLLGVDPEDVDPGYSPGD